MTITRMFGRLSGARTLALFAAAAVVSTTAGAQAAGTRAATIARLTDARWAPWVGCWTPAADSVVITLSGAVAPTSYVCVSPAGEGVEIASIVNGRVIARERVEATGKHIDRTIDGCTGWESASWAEDERRLFTRSEFSCPGNLKRKESGIFAMSAMDEWLDIQGVDVMGATSARATRFREALVAVKPTGTPDSVEISAVDTPERYEVRTARLAAAAPVMIEDVVDALRHVEVPVTEAWLTELHQRFALDAKSLVRLADAGMPPRVIDLMIAVSNPRTFVVARAGNPTVERTPRMASNGRRDSFGNSAMSGLYGSSYADCARYGYGSYFGLSYSDSCYGRSLYGTRYGYDPYGYGLNYYGNQPVIIVTRPDPTTSSRPTYSGKAIAGRGYTRDPSERSSGASDIMGSSQSTRAPSSGAGSSSGSAGGSSAGSSAGGEAGRTAKPRGSGS